jgi:hypothetical protein
MSGESNQIVYEGPLSIESKGVFKKFKKYHCKLASTGITYYKAADDKESEGVVPFTKGTRKIIQSRVAKPRIYISHPHKHTQKNNAL